MSADKPRRAILTIAKPPAEAPARPLEPVIVNRLPHESAEHFARRCASIAALGVNYWQHPQYSFPLRHSRNPEIWQEARAEFLAEIAAAATADRARNPLALMQADVRSVLGRK